MWSLTVVFLWFCYINSLDFQGPRGLPPQPSSTNSSAWRKWTWEDKLIAILLSSLCSSFQMLFLWLGILQWAHIHSPVTKYYMRRLWFLDKVYLLLCFSFHILLSSSNLETMRIFTTILEQSRFYTPIPFSFAKWSLALSKCSAGSKGYKTLPLKDDRELNDNNKNKTEWSDKYKADFIKCVVGNFE